MRNFILGIILATAIVLSQTVDASYFYNRRIVASPNTLNPQAMIHADAGTATAVSLKFTASGSTGQLATDGFDIGASASGSGVIQQFENKDISIQTNGIMSMVISPNGSVGIATTSAVNALGVNGDLALFASESSVVGVITALPTASRSLIRLSNPGSLALHGMGDGTDGKIVTIINASPATMSIVNSSPSAAPGNRISTGLTGSTVDSGIAASASGVFVYDNASRVWRVMTIGAVATASAVSGGGGATNYFQSVDTNNYRVVGAKIAGPSAGSCAVSSEIGGDWINGTPTSSGTGFCTITFQASVFSSAPTCLPVNADVYGDCNINNTATTTNTTIRCFNPSTLADLNRAFEIVCYGPRT